MFKVMVVDDEASGRKSISKMINELSLEAEVVAEAKHGEEALELIRISKPHIVVTDMNMPVMNGQRFLETLHERFGDIRVIVISGYSQFDYMQAAIKYQACEYLLKPVSLHDLRGSLVKAMEASRCYRSLRQQQKEADEMRNMKRSVFLQNVTSQRIANKLDIAHEAKNLHIDAEESSRLIVMMFRHYVGIARSKFHGNADLLLYSIENILLEILREERALVYKSDDRLSICLVVPESSPDGEPDFGWLPPFHDAIQRTLKLEVLAGISEAFDTLADLPEAFRAARKTIVRQRLHGTGLTVSLSEQRSADQDKDNLTSFDVQTIRQALASGNTKGSRKLLSDYLARVEGNAEVSMDRVQHELAKLKETVMSELSGIASAGPADFEPYAIAGAMDGSEVRWLLTRWVKHIEEYGAFRKETESVRLIQRIVAYLDVHYFEDLSLIDVATRYHLDPSYLSKLFKTVTAENFIEYVTRKRMEKASELLSSSDRKISDISELVGYDNQRYFSQVFKKAMGLTPSEYREMRMSPK